MPGKEIDSKGLKGKEPKETGTHEDGRKEVMRGPHHEMGEYKRGEHYHDHHRGK